MREGVAVRLSGPLPVLLSPSLPISERISQASLPPSAHLEMRPPAPLVKRLPLTLLVRFSLAILALFPLRTLLVAHH